MYLISEGIQVPKNKLIHRTQLDIASCEHILDFIFHNGLLQDVAYGITNLKYSTVETQTVPHAVIAASCKHIILYYLQHCQENQFIPLSQSTLYKILKELKPSQRKSQAGLDITTADGLNGYNTLEDILKKHFKSNERLIDSLEKGKRYIRIGYPQHCTDHNPCTSHCISYALSDKLNHNLTKEVLYRVEEHDNICELCSNIFSTIGNIIDAIKESDIPNEADLLYDAKNAREDTFKGVCHSICHVKKKTKQNWML